MSSYIHILLLKYSISFHDADDGECYAGEGSRIIKVFADEQNAIEFANRLNPIFKNAENETIVFPTQKYNGILKQELGFDRFSIDDGYDFNLVVESYNVE